MRRLTELFLGRRSSGQRESVVYPAPSPDQLLYVIGDIHGRLDLLEQLADLIEHDLARRGGQQPLAVFVGDYVDRGENSREVLQRLAELDEARRSIGEVFCLMGNHERMLIDFIDAPARNGRRWLRNGGLQTLASFGVGGVTETAADEQLAAAAEELRDRLGPALEGWLRRRPLQVSSGNVHVAHAGADPLAEMHDQTENALLWGHPRFGEVPRQDGLWLAHGHTVVDAPSCRDGRVSVDTGAWFTGVLTAAAIEPGGRVAFLSTRN